MANVKVQSCYLPGVSGKSQKISVNIVGLWKGNRTRNLRNTKHNFDMHKSVDLSVFFFI
jgi:hypothetical protein